jgi:hypothetical protein
VVFPIVGERLVESCVIFFRNILGVASPDRLLLVDELPLVRHFFDFLLLLVLLVRIIINLRKRARSEKKRFV